ncbi:MULTISPECIES: glutaredoxin 3 [Kordiimonas]|uniref:glutaredoxin 3 n=1 Tax=Kordiimonas TaxID=288021 RepID=UPI001FF25154|nr:glutaredoxin 3 [Kordiimonas sp. SCSIO 12603]MCK0071132.1 glutaredoxin 3 [Kordiimonas laminariae]UTW59488.1 glutaredoxin 3 [Kordiimonas sp. SCSIO 12603]
MANVVIYSSSMCPYCFRAKALLKQKGVSFKEINVDLKPNVRAEMRKKAGGVNTVPQIWIGDTHVGGCDDLYALEAKGALSTMLA